MPDYRRPMIAGATYFLTLVARGRRPLFADRASIDVLRRSLQAVRRRRRFEIDAAVVLPDHLHFLWTIPDGDVSACVGLFKASATRAFRTSGRRPPLDRRREGDVWQKRFWDHVIRNERDLSLHLDYIHYNPVKHGFAQCPHQWQASSFDRWVEKGVYAFDWRCQCDGKPAKDPCPSAMEAGE